MVKESKRFETRQNTEKHYNWDNISKKWENYLDNVELTGLQGKWDVPLQPVQEIREDELPPDTTAYDFVTQLAGMHMGNNEQFLSSNVITDCIHDLDYGFKIVGMQNKGVTKKDIVQQLNAYIKNHNFAVHAQKNEDKLTQEDYINYANMKGQSLMNSLFIGPYRQDDGWGMSARDYIRSIATQTENLTTRPYFYTGQSVEISDDAFKYEKNVYDKYDVIYQELLPHNMSITSAAKNGYFSTWKLPTLQIQLCQDTEPVRLACVPSKQEAKSVKESGVKTKCKVVSGALDLDFLKENADHKINMQKSIDRSFKFYYVGEFVERKNLADVVTAFNLAFRDNENVSLIIKTSVPGKGAGDGQRMVKQALAQHKKMLNIGQVRDEFVITERLSDKDLIGLHNACDCFVMASYGEAFCRPAAEALVLGKTPIVTDHTGMTDFVNKKNGFIISSQKTPVVTSQRTLADSFDIYNANSYWYRPNIYVLVDHMRQVYEMNKKDRKTLEEKRQLGKESMDQFSYETIGKKLCS